MLICTARPSELSSGIFCFYRQYLGATMDTDYTVISDGGCVNGNPGDTYGSYQIKTRRGHARIERCSFGHGTSNTAEYMTLITALGDIIAKCTQAGMSPAAFTVLCITDSQLVVKQINGEFGCHDESLRELLRRATEHLKRFKSYRVEWKRRDHIVGVLGH